MDTTPAEQVEAQLAQLFLRVVHGTDHGKAWELHPGASYVLGRSHKCNLRLTDQTTSATHARLECVDGVWRITDLDSSHGTRVNNIRILSPKYLFDRDRIRLGKTVLEFREYETLDADDLAQIEKGIRFTK